MIRKSNAFAALTVMVLLVILFSSYYLIMKPYQMTFNSLSNDDRCIPNKDAQSCGASGCSWENNACSALPQAARDTISFNRKIWLIAPFILAVGLILWLISVSVKRDPQEYYFR